LRRAHVARHHGVPDGGEPNYSLIEEIVSEAFMPVAYGGGIRSVEQVRRIFHLGV
jgi:cyclase